MSRNTDKIMIMITAISFATILLSLSIVKNTNALTPILPDTNNTELKQVLVDEENIKNMTSKGTYTNKEVYQNDEWEKFYNVTNLFDGRENSYSFWSQQGNSFFNVEFDKELKSPICSAIVGVYNPALNTAFDLTLFNNVSQIVKQNGNLNALQKEVVFDNCLSNVEMIQMAFKPNNPKDFTHISELKLYTNSNVINPPPLECPDGYHIEGNQCVKDPEPPPPPNNNNTGGINNQTTITNSTIILEIKNSTVTVETEDSNLSFPNVTIPNPPDIDPIPIPPINNTNSTSGQESLLDSSEDDNDDDNDNKNNNDNDEDNDKDDDNKN